MHKDNLVKVTFTYSDEPDGAWMLFLKTKDSKSVRKELEKQTEKRGHIILGVETVRHEGIRQ